MYTECFKIREHYSTKMFEKLNKKIICKFLSSFKICESLNIAKYMPRLNDH